MDQDDASDSEPEEEIVEEEIVEESVSEEFELMDARALPIRAKPLFHNSREEVDEFPYKKQRTVYPPLRSSLEGVYSAS